MTRPGAFALATLLSLAFIGASAHEGHSHKKLMGTVRSINATRLELTLKDGTRPSIPLSKHTKILRGKESVGVDQLKPGLRVVVVLSEDDKTAEAIKLGVSPAK